MINTKNVSGKPGHAPYAAIAPRSDPFPGAKYQCLPGVSHSF